MGNLFGQFIRFSNRAFHAFRALGKHQLGAVSLHKLTAFHRHGLGHNDNNPVTSGRRHSRQTDSGVAGSRFDDNRAGLQFSGFLRLIEHRLGNTVFYRTARIKIFQFRKDFCFQMICLLNMSQF